MHTDQHNYHKDDVMPSEALYHAQIPADPATRWQAIPQALENLKSKAKKLGLWNLWLSGGDFQGMAGGEGGGLTNLEVRLLLTYQSKLRPVSFIGEMLTIMMPIVCHNGRSHGSLDNPCPTSYQLLGPRYR